MASRWVRVAVFLSVTFAVTHALSLGYLLRGGSWGGPGSYAFANALMLCPAAVALGLQRFVYREPVAASLGLRWPPAPWLAVSVLLPLIVVLGALGFSLLAPGARYAPDMSGLPPEMASFKGLVASMGLPPFVGMLALGLALGPTLNAVGGLGEELGWRGFVYQQLAPLGFWRCSLVTGTLWGLWHVPLWLEGYGDHDHGVVGPLTMVAFAMLLAPILHLVRLRSGSVVACGVLHGTMSSTRLLSVAFVTGAGPWADAAIPFALLVVNGVLAAWVRRERVHRRERG